MRRRLWGIGNANIYNPLRCFGAGGSGAGIGLLGTPGGTTEGGAGNRFRTIYYSLSASGVALNTQIQTIANWQSLQDSVFGAGTRIGDQSAPGSIIASGDGRWIGAAGFGVLESAKYTGALAILNNFAVEVDCILSPGTPTDSFDRSIWVWLLGQKSAAPNTGSGNGGGILAALQTNGLQVYNNDPSGSAGTLAAIYPDSVTLTLRFERQDSAFRVYVNSLLQLTCTVDPTNLLAISDGGFGFGFASSTGSATYPKSGVQKLRLTGL